MINFFRGNPIPCCVNRKSVTTKKSRLMIEFWDHVSIIFSQGREQKFAAYSCSYLAKFIPTLFLTVWCLMFDFSYLAFTIFLAKVVNDQNTLSWLLLWVLRHFERLGKFQKRNRSSKFFNLHSLTFYPFDILNSNFNIVLQIRAWSEKSKNGLMFSNPFLHFLPIPTYKWLFNERISKFWRCDKEMLRLITSCKNTTHSHGNVLANTSRATVSNLVFWIWKCS